MTARRTPAALPLLLAGLAATAAMLPAQSLREVQVPAALPAGSTLVVGFLGGWESWNDPDRGVRRVALELRSSGQPGLYAETFANRRRSTARRAILRALDANGNRRIDPEERQRVRIILYGQSLGGGAVVRLARELRREKIPVELTVQVDSVSLADSVIPPNVRSAANFYQEELFSVRGEPRIAAADPAQTTILGNFQRRYPFWVPYPQPKGWARRYLGGAHARMEADPTLWLEVKSLILAAAAPSALKLR